MVLKKYSMLTFLNAFPWVTERLSELLNGIVGFVGGGLPNLHACPKLGF
jgi:hypothetical protein